MRHSMQNPMRTVRPALPGDPSAVLGGRPVLHADQVGLKAIAQRLAHYAAADGEPTPITPPGGMT